MHSIQPAIHYGQQCQKWCWSLIVLRQETFSHQRPSWCHDIQEPEQHCILPYMLTETSLQDYIFTLDSHQHRQVLSSFYASTCPSIRQSVHLSIRNNVTALIPKGFQLSAWNLVGWCTVQWSKLLFKMAMSAIFFTFHGTLEFFMIGLDQVWGITLLL